MEGYLLKRHAPPLGGHPPTKGSPAANPPLNQRKRQRKTPAPPRVVVTAFASVLTIRRDSQPTEGKGAIMATDARAELRVDVHQIEPIPEADTGSTGPQQMWIWAVANIAPINWALGALGIVLRLGLWETIAIIVLGNIVGCAIFAAFTVMGHKTGSIRWSSVVPRSVAGERTLRSRSPSSGSSGLATRG